MASATFSGTVTPSVSETDFASGGYTMIITLTGDTWIPAGATFDANLAAWCADNSTGIVSDQGFQGAPYYGWFDMFHFDFEPDTGVSRDSDTQLTFTFTDAVTGSNLSGFNTGATETITGTIPLDMLTSEVGFAITGSFQIEPAVAAATTSTPAGKWTSRDKYPKWIEVNGKTYRVRNAAEEDYLVSMLLKTNRSESVKNAKVTYKKPKKKVLRIR